MAEEVNTLSAPFFYDCVIEDNTVYFPLANYNSLCKGNLISGQTDIIDIFPDIPAYKTAAYAGVYKYGNTLLFSPYSADNFDILVYSIPQQTFSGLLNNKDINFRSNTVFEKNEYIYIASCTTNEIYKIDLHNRSVDCLVSAKNKPDEYCYTEIVRIRDFILFPLNQRKVLLVFDMQKEKCECYEFPDDISYISTLCVHGENLWITGGSRKIYTWNIKKQEVRVCAEFPDNVRLFFEGNGHYLWFGSSFIYQDVLWLFPFYASVILKYNILTEKFEELEIPGEEETDGLEKARFNTIKYGTVKKSGDKVFFLSSKTRIFYELDLVTNMIQRHYFYVNKKYNGQIYPVTEDGKILERNDAVNLEDFLENIKERANEEIIIKDEMTGGTIYNCIDRKISRLV